MGILEDLGFRKPKKKESPVGRSGTVNTSGFISDQEVNRNLRWPYSLEQFEQMRKTDPTIRWALAMVSTPIRAATWTVEPAAREPEYIEQAAFAEEALMECLEGGFDEFLRQALTFLDFGHSVFEMVASLETIKFSFEVEEEAPAPEPVLPEPGPEDVETEPQPGPPEPGAPPPMGGLQMPPPKPKTVTKEEEVEREAFIVRKLAPRLQRTIQKWNVDESDSSKLVSIEQSLADGKDNPNPTIQADRLVVFTNEREGDEFRGTSILRSAYKSYEYKMRLENLEAIAYERSAGMPVVYPPSNASGPALDSVEEAVADLRQGESLYVVMPGPKQGTLPGVEGWLLEDLAIRGEGDADATAAISRYEAAMARNVLAEFMRLGHENTGARATGDVQQDPYWQAINAVVHYIEDVITEQVIAPMVSWNYETDRYPTLKATKIQGKNIETLSTAITSLSGAGALHLSTEDENMIREILDMPKRKVEDIEDEEQRKTAEEVVKAQELAKATKNGGPPEENGKPPRPFLGFDVPGRLSPIRRVPPAS